MLSRFIRVLAVSLTPKHHYLAFQSLWCIFASNLMLGSDLRNISNTTLAIISNEEGTKC